MDLNIIHPLLLDLCIIKFTLYLWDWFHIESSKKDIFIVCISFLAGIMIFIAITENIYSIEDRSVVERKKKQRTVSNVPDTTLMLAFMLVVYAGSLSRNVVSSLGL